MVKGKSNTRTVVRAQKIGVNGEITDLGIIASTTENIGTVSDFKSEKVIDKVIEPTNKS